jgi:transposase-like protein
MRYQKFLSNESTPNCRRYSEAFKRQVVRDYENRLLNKDQLMRKYAIGGKSQILEWCRRYGKFAYPKNVRAGTPMKDPQKQRIKDLEQALQQANLKVKAYEKLIAITEKEQGISIIKKDGAKQSTNSDRNTPQ